MLSMRALDCLVTIVEQGSLTKAAAALHMSQPALSHQTCDVRDDGTRLRLEPGQSVVPHGPDRDLTTEEIAPGKQP
jgi:Bacterial regulatory helix-turn-helix protein, lysR family